MASEIRHAIVERVIERRGRLHLFDSLDPKKTALVVIDMQNAFVAPGAPMEVPAARAIVAPINRLAAELRKRAVTVIWISHQNAKDGRDWSGFFDSFIAPGRRADAAAALSAGSELQKLWPELQVAPSDLRLTKNRYSALIRGASDLEQELRKRGIDTLLIAGTKTNVCCECTARDAMMLDYKVVLLSDCTAALSDDEQRATLENVIQQFGDVLMADEVLALL
jgi:ureidoacrylate peracid hydrolase